MSLLNGAALICVLAVAVVVATETDTPRRVCVSLESDEEQQDFDCIRCNSTACVNNANDSTHIQFVSKTFVLKDTLHISNREDIHLEGIANPETRITCVKQSQEEIGLEFINIQNLTIVNITVESCGVRSQQMFLGRYRIYSAIFLIHCTHVYISGVRVLQSVGSGLAIMDTNGTVTVEETLFENNGIGDVAEVVGAGGLYLQYSCFSNPQLSICSQLWSLNTTYAFTDCNFTNNNANIPESIALNDNQKRLLGRGGGLGVVMSDGAASSHIILTRCHFLNNTATWGGGMHVWFRKSSAENLLVVQNCYFKNNHCPNRAGGAVNIVQDNSPKGNQMTFENITFVENSAGFGGGVGILSSPMMILFNFSNCSWVRNEAQFSSALDVLFKTQERFSHGYPSQVTLSDCVFISNTILKSEKGADSLEQEQYKEGKGALVVTGYSIQFEGNTTFSGNNGTALFLVTSTAIFAPHSTVLFEGNSGLEGGAVALIGSSAIHVQQSSRFTFRNNHAYTSGGAIYYTSMDQHEYFMGSSNCFIRRLDKSGNVSFIFDGNQAGGSYGQDIQATTLKQCKHMCNARNTTDPVEIFKCIGQFNFTDKPASVSTSGRLYLVDESKIPINVIPGKEFQIPFESRDDLNNTSKGYYSVRVQNCNGSNVVVDPAYTLITNEHMKLYGQPGDTAKLIVTKVGTRPITLVLKVRLSLCPPGFDIQNITTSNKKLSGLMCVCSYNYEGIIQCNDTHYFAYAKRGHWVGYEGRNVHTSHCPDGYCFYGEDQQNIKGLLVYRLPTEASLEELDKAVCGPYRTGVVCGKCASNYSVYYHTYTLSCGSNDLCSVGWVLYIVSELLPLTMLFLVVIYFNISFTSGAASGFIFFAQVTDSLAIRYKGSIWLNPVVYNLTLVYRFIYRFFNFDFFSKRVFAFCLIKGATALDVLAFKYVTVLYALIMIFVLIIMFKYCNMPISRKCPYLIKHTNRSFVIHGLSAFIIMCYMQCIRVSFFLLIPIAIHSQGRKNVRNVVFLNGEVDYFSKAHLPYALPAIACLTFALILPVLLIVYPLHYRFIAALRLEEKQWFSKSSKYISLERMKPLLDSFQSCFKDKCRFFAGLYFFYRFLLLLLFAVTTSYTVFYAVVEVQLIVILAVNAYVQPYQKQLYNVIDTLVFTNLAIINAITLLNYSISSKRGQYVKVVDIFSSIQLILVFLPLCCLVGYAVYKAILKVKTWVKREASKTEEEEEEKDVEELEMPARLIYEDETSSSDDGSTDYQHYEDGETNMSH